jgi:hypothetical protein
MVNSYTNTSQTLNTNDVLTFATNRTLNGCSVTHTEGTGTFVLKKPGYYYVFFNGSGAAETAGNIVVQLLSNGVEVPGAVASGYSAANTNEETVSFSTIIKVLPSCACVNNTTTISLQNTGVETTFSNLNIVITKLC